jgi:hypothetical protein
MKEATKKLPYDIPLGIAEQFKIDCKKEGTPATQVLIRLMQEYQKEIEKGT